MDALPLVAIVGVPNVGKSTLFNRLVGQRRAIVTDEPGVTRDRIYGIVRREGRAFRVVDTGGLASAGDRTLADGIGRQALRALDEAAVALFVVDARSGATAADHDVATTLRKKGIPLILVANKVDAPSVEARAPELGELGVGDPVPVSAEHGLGIDELLDAVDAALRSVGEGARAEAGPERADVRVAIIGRPNVGKSSVVNRILGEERVLVGEAPGTTRDAVDTPVEVAGRRFVLVDTAGIRRGGRARRTAEALSVLRATDSLARCDVAVLVLDATHELAAQDAHVAGLAWERSKPLVVAVNKWDLVESREEAAKSWERDVRSRLRFAKEAPFLFVSAKSGQRVLKLLEEAAALYDRAGIRVSTPELNRWLREVADRERAGPAGGRSIRLFYATQLGVRPPRFLLFCNDARHVHFSLRRHLENGLRERFGYGAVPLSLRFRSRRAENPS